MALFMSFLGGLFGCSDVAESGPDFDVVINKTLHIDDGIRVEYQVPTNMSNLMGFADKYKKESPVSRSVDCAKADEFNTVMWRKTHKVDGAMWDYHSNKMFSSKELASLNLELEVWPVNDAMHIIDMIEKSYNDYLDGDEGINTRVRNNSPGVTDAEIGDWILRKPNEIAQIKLDDLEFLSWEIDGEVTGRKSIYYVLPLNSKCHLLAWFHYAIHADSSEEYDKADYRIRTDIHRIVSTIERAKN